MEVEVKTLAGDTFKVQCVPNESIRDVKEKIASRTDLKEKYTVELLKLLYKGKVLDDEETFGSYSVEPTGFLVLVKQTPGKAPPPKKKQPMQGFGNNGFGNSGFGSGGFGSGGFGSGGFGSAGFGSAKFGSAGGFNSPNAFMQQQSFNQNASMQQPQFQPDVPTYNPPVAAPEPSVPNAEREEALQNLIAMGFERAVSEKALRASNYNIDTAVDYITSGAIHSVDDEPEIPQGATGQTAQLQQMSEMLKNNPQQLQALKQKLQVEHPEIAQMIDERPQDFISLLNQAGGSDNTRAPAGGASVPGGQAPGTIQVTLSPQEQQAITRVENMGFERNRVIEAFLACDRNEELAVNYLLSSFD